jgi:hypothetical protein
VGDWRKTPASDFEDDEEEKGGMRSFMKEKGMTFPANRAWTRAAGQKIADRLSADTGMTFSVIGSVATRGRSENDLDLLVSGEHEWCEGRLHPEIVASMTRMGFDYAWQQLVSPKEAQNAGKWRRGGGEKFVRDRWSETHHFKHRETGHGVEIWTTLKPDVEIKSLQVDLPDDIARKVKRLAQMIPDDELYMEGRGDDV